MKLRRLTAMVLMLMCLASCSTQAEEHSATIMAMDTVMGITAYGPGGEAAVGAAVSCIQDLESLLSVTAPDSEIYAANHSGGEAISVSNVTADLLARALEICAQTDGALDVTIYPLVRTWGFTTGEYQVPDEAALTELIKQVDFSQIRLDGNTLIVPKGMELDLGAVAKGYTGDQVVARLQEAGITSAKLELGGNVQLLGAKPDGSPWRVAVRDPSGEGYAGILEVTDQAVVTSGGYERYFEQDGITYWHIIDPDSGQPARTGLVSVTIVASSGVLADGLSTALFVMGAKAAEEYWRAHPEFDFILIDEDGTVTITPGLADRFTPYEDWAGHKLELLN